MKYGSFTKISAWIDTNTCSSEESFVHDSPAAPLHVPSSDKHTLPQLYKFGSARAQAKRKREQYSCSHTEHTHTAYANKHVHALKGLAHAFVKQKL